MPTTQTDINSGEIIIPPEAVEIINGTPSVNYATQEQLQEIENGYAAGYDLDTPATPIDLDLYPEETVYRKRIVKVQNGKIVDEKIIYMKRYLISSSGGYGDGYALLLPSVHNGELVLTPAKFTLN